jgi:ribosomal protein L11 methyltransferase
MGGRQVLASQAMPHPTGVAAGRPDIRSTGDNADRLPVSATLSESRWIRVQVWPSGALADLPAAATYASLVAALVEHGSPGVVEDGDTLIGFVPRASLDEGALQATIARLDMGARMELQTVVDADWAHRWREGIQAHTVGPLVVAPPWLAANRDPARTVIIEPGMAFGTGEHPTTRGVLRLLAGVIRSGDFVADLGAGSAVLSIAAAKLGARRVAAVELDPDAIGNAEENIDRNGVTDRVSVLAGDAATLLPLLAPVRLITANIVSSVLIDLLPVMASVLSHDGQAILGGILVEERDTMRDVLSAGGWHVVDDDVEGEWWSTIIARR